MTSRLEEAAAAQPALLKAINYILEPHRPVAADQTTPEATL